MGLVTVAAVQAAPVFLDRDATVEKACGLVCEAGRAGARLVAFPEVFVAGFPHWIYLDRPQANEGYFVEAALEAVDVPSAATEALGRAAQEAAPTSSSASTSGAVRVPGSCSTLTSSSLRTACFWAGTASSCPPMPRR
jgi:hypothetical protein